MSTRGSRCAGKRGVSNPTVTRKHFLGEVNLVRALILTVRLDERCSGGICRSGLQREKWEAGGDGAVDILNAVGEEGGTESVRTFPSPPARG